jgi:hypothetical protein
MYLLHLALTNPDWPSPVQADAEQLEDRIWARAAPDLGIQHLHAKAGPHHIDLAVYLAGAGPEKSPGADGTPVQHILALIPEWAIAPFESPSHET